MRYRGVGEVRSQYIRDSYIDRYHRLKGTFRGWEVEYRDVEVLGGAYPPRLCRGVNIDAGAIQDVTAV